MQTPTISYIFTAVYTQHVCVHAVHPTAQMIKADERAYERTVRDRVNLAQREKSEQEMYLREGERQKAIQQMFGKKVRTRARCTCVRREITPLFAI